MKKEDYIHIDALEVARKFGYLIAGKGKFSGLEFAKKIIGCDKDCQSHRETCASSVASTVYEIQLCGMSGCCMIPESL
jgi:hypothetical protein